jgi:hypothetical protein
MNTGQKKKLVILGAISIFLGVGYYAYVKVKDRRDKKKEAKEVKDSDVIDDDSDDSKVKL